jgi:hypothetical protein
LKVRKTYDELAELGGIPPRPLLDFQAENLTDEQREDDDGELCLINLFLDEGAYWERQLRLWKRFMQRRKQDGEPDIRDLDRIDAVAAFVGYLRGHLQRDMLDRAEPWVEQQKWWLDYTAMSSQRFFIENILDSLPAAEALLQQLRNETAEILPEEPEVTSEGLRKEYDIPHLNAWYDIWMQIESAVPEPSSRKRQREDDAQEEEGSSPERLTSDSVDPVPIANSTASPCRKKKKQSSSRGEVELEKPKLERSSEVAANGIGLSNSSSIKETKATKKTRELAQPSQRSRPRAGKKSSGANTTGLRRSARIVTKE